MVLRLTAKTKRLYLNNDILGVVHIDMGNPLLFFLIKVRDRKIGKYSVFLMRMFSSENFVGKTTWILCGC